MGIKTIKKQKANAWFLGCAITFFLSILPACGALDEHREKVNEVEKIRAFLYKKCSCDWVGYSAKNLHANFKKLNFHLIGCEDTLLESENEWIFDELKNSIPFICEVDVLVFTFTNKGENKSVIYYECSKANR